MYGFSRHERGEGKKSGGSEVKGFRGSFLSSSAASDFDHQERWKEREGGILSGIQRIHCCKRGKEEEVPLRIDRRRERRGNHQGSGRTAKGEDTRVSDL